MCKKCKNNSCSGCSSEAPSLAQLTNRLNELEAELEQVKTDTKFLSCGHPIMMIQNANDIEAFNMETGEGSNCWDGWGICNGNTYQDSEGNNFTSPNLTDRFIVAAGGVYDVDQVGGVSTVTLTAAQMPSHTHSVTDPGHLHAIDDDGHTHAASSAPHSHTASGAPHNHSMDSAGAHTHDVTVHNQGSGLRSGGETDTATSGDQTHTTTSAGAHTHTIANAAVTVDVDEATAAVEVDEAATGIEVLEAFTGITVGSAGGGEAHTNIPPYYALLFVIKIG